jgi:hypothetical protein
MAHFLARAPIKSAWEVRTLGSILTVPLTPLFWERLEPWAPRIRKNKRPDLYRSDRREKL